MTAVKCIFLQCSMKWLIQQSSRQKWLMLAKRSDTQALKLCGEKDKRWYILLPGCTYNTTVRCHYSSLTFFLNSQRFIKMLQNKHLSQSSVNQDINSIISMFLVFWLQINMQVIAMLHSAFISFAVLNYLISTCSISEASPVNRVSKCLWAFSTSLL